MTSKSANRYSPEFRERAVRMLLEQRGEYRSEHAAIHSLAPKIGCSTDPCAPGSVSMNGTPVVVMAG